MTAVTINIPNKELGFFKKMAEKIGWTYSLDSTVKSPSSAKERKLAKIDHALHQLQQMKDGTIQGLDAEELLNDL